MKKFRLIFLLSLSLILNFGTTSFGATFNGEEIAETSSVNDNFYGVQTVKNIMNDLDITYDESDLLAYTYYTNKALQKFQQTYSDVKVVNACFYNTNNTLRMIVSNGSFSNSVKYLYVNCPGKQIRYFDSWSYGGANNSVVTGVNSSICTYITINKDSINQVTNSISIGACEFVDDVVKVSNLLSPISTYTVACQNNNYKYNWYFLGNIIRFSKVDTPDTGESGDTGSGDNSGDSGESGGESGGNNISLEMTNQKIDQLNQHAEQILENMPTSGDIKEATTQGTVQGNKDYWGNTEEMEEDDYENEISGGVNNTINQISGDLSKNEVFNSIAIAEQKIIDLFLEEPGDFKISWQDVIYLDKTLVPAGEVNFSQMCRENEELGKVKSTLNIIVSAMVSLSLFKYIFNLIMVTLGIDHPLVLEEQKDDITEISRTKIGNKTYVTKKTYKSDKKGGR